MQISKTDFLLYLEAPLHLWAKKHNKIEQVVPTPYDLHLMEQGNQVENLAIEYFNEIICKNDKDLGLARRKRFTDGSFQAEVDALVFDPSVNIYDIYEIKSSTGIDIGHKYDVTFQYLVCKEKIPVRNFYIVHLDRDYVCQSGVQVAELFKVECLDHEIAKLAI